MLFRLRKMLLDIRIILSSASLLFLLICFIPICQFNHCLGMGPATPFREESTNDPVRENTGPLLSRAKLGSLLGKTVSNSGVPSPLQGWQKGHRAVMSVLHIPTAQVLMVALCRALRNLFLPLKALKLALGKRGGVSAEGEIWGYR